MFMVRLRGRKAAAVQPSATDDFMDLSRPGRETSAGEGRCLQGAAELQCNGDAPADAAHAALEQEHGGEPGPALPQLGRPLPAAWRTTPQGRPLPPVAWPARLG